jgi:alpha-methylacyl-CoA racemase
MGRGPLAGLKVVEFAGIGPAPYCGMLLSDLGADVVRVDRITQSRGVTDIVARGRRSVALDLKQPVAVETCFRLIEQADALIEGFRPGVMERLGLGPDSALERNPRLVYGRMTGWGQVSPYAQAAGHDINYIAVTGALSGVGYKNQPMPPLNLIGDFGGGSLFLAFGLLAGVMHARETGEGQVIDCAITDGVASMMSMIQGMWLKGIWRDEREANLLDGGAPFYGCYQCSDGLWVSIGANEEQFYATLMRLLEIPVETLPPQMSREGWPVIRQAIKSAFARKTRPEWCLLLEGTDACFAPVLNLIDVAQHPHNLARETFVEVEGVLQAAPAPKFSRTPGEIQGPPPEYGAHSRSALQDWGFGVEELDQMEAQGALYTHRPQSEPAA